MSVYADLSPRDPQDLGTKQSPDQKDRPRLEMRLIVFKRLRWLLIMLVPSIGPKRSDFKDGLNLKSPRMPTYPMIDRSHLLEWSSITSDTSAAGLNGCQGRLNWMQSLLQGRSDCQRQGWDMCKWQMEEVGLIKSISILLFNLSR